MVYKIIFCSQKLRKFFRVKNFVCPSYFRKVFFSKNSSKCIRSHLLNKSQQILAVYIFIEIFFLFFIALLHTQPISLFPSPKKTYNLSKKNFFLKNFSIFLSLLKPYLWHQHQLPNQWSSHPLYSPKICLKKFLSRYHLKLVCSK